MELKRATIEDVDTYLTLEKSVSGSKLFSGAESKEEALEELSGNVVYFILNNGQTVGIIAYEMKDPAHAYLSSILIDPRYQGQGLAREALKKILEELKDAKIIDLVTHPDNTSAVHLYQSFGFKITERYENYFGDGEPRVKLILNKND